MADEGRIPIKRALVSVFDKEGIEDLAAALKDLGVSVISTGGTAKKLAAAGESLRLSTHLRSRNPTSTPFILHPRSWGGVCCRWDLAQAVAASLPDGVVQSSRNGFDR